MIFGSSYKKFIFRDRSTIELACTHEIANVIWITTMKSRSSLAAIIRYPIIESPKDELRSPCMKSQPRDQGDDGTCKDRPPKGT